MWGIRKNPVSQPLGKGRNLALRYSGHRKIALKSMMCLGIEFSLKKHRLRDRITKKVRLH